VTYTLRFLPEVEDDVVVGYAWYEAKTRGLGEEFLRVFYVGVGDVSRNPLLYSMGHRDVRRRLLRRFPYTIYFRIEGNEVIVLGLFHCARDPRTVRAKLWEREKP